MIVPDAWLEHLRMQVPVIQRDTDPEGVHQLRVAAGRLSVWLELGSRRMLRDDLRWLRRSASAVRDLDVLLAHAPNGEWTDALLAERHRHLRELNARIADPRFEALTFAISVAPGVQNDVAREVLSKLRRRAARAGKRITDGKTDARALHRLRRTLRRLRYALEWLEEDASDVKRIQDELGELNDLTVRLERLEAAPADPALDAMRAVTQTELAACRARALESWRTLAEPITGR